MSDNPLAQYINREYKDVIKSLQVVQRTSKDGNPYFCIEMHLVNGFDKIFFTSREEVFAWSNAFDMLDSNIQEVMD